MKKLIAGLSLLLIASTVLCAAPKKAKKTKKAKPMNISVFSIQQRQQHQLTTVITNGLKRISV